MRVMRMYFVLGHIRINELQVCPIKSNHIDDIRRRHLLVNEEIIKNFQIQLSSRLNEETGRIAEVIIKSLI